MNKSRVTAFTIMEVTITMLVSATVIGIMYTAYSIVSSAYGSYHKKNEQMSNLLQLDKLLKKDFAGADSIYKDRNDMVFYGVMDSVKYDFEPDYILRTSKIVDTFRFKSQDIISSFENQQLNEIHPVKEQNRVDDLGLVILFQDEKIPYHYHKEYSSANLIERNPNAFN